MRTRVLQIEPERPDPASLAEAAAILASGGLVAFATETVYGLGAVASEPDVVARIFQAKGRPSYNPLIVHMADAGQARTCVERWPESAERLAGRFWPGPLTLVLRGSGLIPPITTGGRETVALRVPATPVALGLIRHVGLPLAAPSANRSNRLSPTSARHVLADLDGRIELVLDSGPTALGLESTVLDLTTSPVRILRPGPIGPEEITACLAGLGHVEVTRPEPTSQAPISPGLLPVHYAPRTASWRAESVVQLTRFAWPASASLLILGRDQIPDLPDRIDCLRIDEPRAAARRLYGELHAMDAQGKEAIVVFMPPDEPEWAAVRDRLIRATRPIEA